MTPIDFKAKPINFFYISQTPSSCLKFVNIKPLYFILQTVARHNDEQNIYTSYYIPWLHEEIIKLGNSLVFLETNLKEIWNRRWKREWWAGMEYEWSTLRYKKSLCTSGLYDVSLFINQVPLFVIFYARRPLALSMGLFSTNATKRFPQQPPNNQQRSFSQNPTAAAQHGSHFQHFHWLAGW